MSSTPTSAAPTSICVCTPSDGFLEVICDYLSDFGFSCLPAASGSAALRLCRYARVDALIIDLALGDESVKEVLVTIAEGDFPAVGGILALGDRHEGGRDLEVLSEGLAGVDDYLSKPFQLEQLLVQVRRIFWRRHNREADIFRLGELTVDPPRRKVTVGEREVRLSKKEFTLLRVLATDPTRVFTKDELLREGWGLKYPNGGTRTLDSHASRLRRKLDPERERFVINSWGVGYRLVKSIADASPEPADGGAG